MISVVKHIDHESAYNVFPLSLSRARPPRATVYTHDADDRPTEWNETVASLSLSTHGEPENAVCYCRYRREEKTLPTYTTIRQSPTVCSVWVRESVELRGERRKFTCSSRREERWGGGRVGRRVGERERNECEFSLSFTQSFRNVFGFFGGSCAMRARQYPNVFQPQQKLNVFTTRRRRRLSFNAMPLKRKQHAKRSREWSEIECVSHGRTTSRVGEFLFFFRALFLLYFCCCGCLYNNVDDKWSRK